MHICFVIDNSPTTKQTYTQSVTTNNLHTNLTILETIKMSIQSMLNEMAKNGVLVWEFQTFHLFVTSNPHTPLSSFEHDRLHFSYQLKQVKSSDYVTYPAQTLKFALRHVSKFRVMTEAETILGYRTNSVYEPVFIIFFSYGLTQRRIAKIQSIGIQKLMRSQYKFIHFRLCYPSLIEKDKNLQKFKNQCQNSVENKRLSEFAQKMNRGEHKNILKYQGKSSLADSLIKFITSYKPCLFGLFYLDTQIKLQFPQYFKNSQINPQKFLVNEQSNGIKVQLFRTDQSYRSYIPIPMEVNVKNIGLNNIQTIPQIEEVGNLKFFIDLSKKLSGTISSAVPFVSYSLVNTPPKLSKLEKQLQRLGITKIFFPVYVSNTAPGPKKQKSYFLSGFLHFCIDSRVGNFFELMLSYPNFPFIEWVISLITNQKSYADGRKIQKLLIDYHNGIPQFYHKFISQYFKLESSRTPALSVYQTVAANNWNNPSLPNIGVKNNLLKEQQNLKRIVAQQYMERAKIKKQNEDKHIQGRAECCPIYNNIEAYIQYSRSISKINKNQNICQSVLSDLLSKVSLFNQKSGFKSYFGGSEAWKESPMARQISKYSQKLFLTGETADLNEVDPFAYDQTNQSYEEAPIGIRPTKRAKISQIIQENQDSNSKMKKSVINQQQIGDLDSVMPENDKYQQYFKDQNEKNKFYWQNQNSIEAIGKNNLLMMPNSVAIDSLKKNNNTGQLIQVQRELIMNKLVMEQDIQFLGNKTVEQGQTQQSRIVRKSSSIDYNDDSDQQIQRNKTKKGLLGYVGRMTLQNPKVMKFNNRNFKNNKFEQNIKNLKSIGFIDNIEKFLTQQQDNL